MKTPRFLLALVFAALAVIGAQATIGLGLQMPLGNPSGATADANNHAHYLQERPQFSLDYNDTTRQANWVSWSLTSTDVGGSGRSDDFFVDTSLPAGFYQVLTTDYSGSGYDRGHMCPSADRTVTRADNDVTFFMSNMVPQTPDNNRGIWANFETYCRTLASAGNEVLITAGTSGFAGSTIASGVAIPGYTWKVVVVVPLGPGSAVDRIVAAGAAAIRVIAIKVPNIAGISGTPWQNFVTSPAQIQADTGYTFFTALPGSMASALRSVVDGSSPVGSPAITSHPTSQTTVVGGSATFSVTATGDAPLSYQWVHDDVDIPGATATSLTLGNVQAANVGEYYVVVTNNVGSTTSNPAALIVTGLPPVITVPPAGQTVTAGANVTFAVAVTGSPTLAYQWRKNLAPISGATSSTLTLINAQAGDAASYDVIVTNSTSSVISAPAVLTVNASAPVITTQPVSRTAVTAENAGFTVVATGTAPLAYQWRKDGAPLADAGNISGATTASLLITGVTAANGGSYDVVITNPLGAVTSSLATLLVNPPPPSTVFWDFGATGSPTALPSSGLSADITGGLLTRANNNGTTDLLTTVSASTGSGASGAFNAGAATVNGPTLNLATSTYFEFTLAPGAGKRLLVSGISFRSRSTGTGPQSLAVYSSADGYASAVATLANTSGTNWALYNPTIAAITGVANTPITFRIYGYNGSGATGSTAVWRIDDVRVTVSAIFPPPVAPEVIATSPANGAANVTVTNPITITFNEAVSFTGSWFTINSASAGPLSASVTGGPTTYNLSTPSALPYNDTITVTVLGAQVVDLASGTIHGTGNTTFAFTTSVFVPPTPPVVTGDPSAQAVNAGSPATFSVTATGTAPLQYQWRRNGTPVSGNASASTATFSIPAATLADAGSYDCVVANVAGSDVSAAATLAVNIVPPAIATQPGAQMVGVGGNATFTAVATGTGPLSYQWRRNGTPLNDVGVFAGTHTATLLITNVTHAEGGSYDVVVTNAAPTGATSNAVALLVTEGAPNVISWDFVTAAPTSGVPAGVTGGTFTPGNNNATTLGFLTTTSASNHAGASGGNNAGLAARVGGLNRAANGSAYYEFSFTPPADRQFAAGALSFGARSTGTGPQACTIFTSADGFANPVATSALANDSIWRVINTPLAGVAGAPGTPITFRIYGHNGAGGASANTANWRIDDVKLTAGLLALPPVPPAVTAPASQVATVGDVVQFTVAATGTAPFTYQWRFNGEPVTGNPSAATATLSLIAITTAHAGSYDCVVTNVAGTTTSAAATLAVNKAAATVTLGNLDFVYNGAAAVATATTAPAGLNVVITYGGGADAPTTAGSYTVVAAVDDANYAGTATGTLTIAKAQASVMLGQLSQVYDGSPKSVSVASSPAGLLTATTYNGSAVPPTNAGTYAVVSTVVDPNYTGSASGTLAIMQGQATVTLGNLVQAYDGTPKPVTAVTNPAGLALTITYDGGATPPTLPGSYAVVATSAEANRTGSATGTLTITITALVRHAPSLNGDVDGSVQVLSPENTTLNGSAMISSDLLVPGTPAVRLNGNPIYVSTLDGTGAAAPSSHVVTLNGNAVLRHVIRRVDAIAMPVVSAPPAPAGSRNVSLNNASQDAGDFATMRDLTLNGNGLSVAVPAGTYGAFTLNGNNVIKLGVAGGTVPVVYNLQGLTLNGSSQVQVLGPVIINLAAGTSLNGVIGAPAHPEWVTVNIASGGLTLNSNAAVHGAVIAPAGTVTINGNSVVRGRVVADRLTINGNGLLTGETP
jgi:DNA/RNA endonuclease G (NUC1)